MTNVPEGTDLVYVNWVRTNATPFDIGIDVGYNDAPGPPDSYPVRLLMTWEHAKAFVELLERNIQSYEEEVGSLRDLIDRTEEDDDR